MGGWVLGGRDRDMGGKASEGRGQVLKVRVQGTQGEEDRIRGRERERGSSGSISGAGS